MLDQLNPINVRGKINLTGLNRIFTVLAGLLLLSSVIAAQESGTLRGVITDAAGGDPLPGANIVLVGTTLGTASDIDGAFIINDVPAGTYTMKVTFIGYQDVEVRGVTISAGAVHDEVVQLRSAVVGLNTVTVSASRRPEKVLDAPASITVLEAREIEADVSQTAVSVLKNVTGVDIAQTGIDRREVVLRGFNNAFSGAAYVLTDNRQAAVAALGLNLHSIMPNMGIDLDRVEVVRGPGSALYGAGVTSGVIHYFTKDPFDHPGTTFSIAGGERSTVFAALRTAGTFSENVGYKITAQYARAEDWKLDPDDPVDSLQLGDNPLSINRDYDYNKFNINGLLKFRLGEQTSLTANAGIAEITTTTLTGVGGGRAEGWGYRYGQLRLQSGGFFLQAYLNANDAGNTFSYETGDKLIDNSFQANIQGQYDWRVSDRQSLVLGVDLDNASPDTDGTIYGRNEDDDRLTELGAYLHSTSNLNSKLDFTVAVRADYDNILQEAQLSPRVGVIFKASPTSSFRATYNRAFSLPNLTSLFLDLELAFIDPITVRGVGSRNGYTFRRNPDYLPLAGSDLVARSLIPGREGEEQPVGLPLDEVYQQVYDALTAISTDSIQTLLANNGITVSTLQIDVIRALLNPDPDGPTGSPTTVDGFSQGRLGIPNLSDGGQISFIDDVEDSSPLKHTITQSYEVGYKGLIANKVLVAVDGYYTRKKNFVGPLSLETPGVYVPGLAADFEMALTEGINNNAVLVAALNSAGVSPEVVAAFIAQTASGSLPNNETPVALVVPRENDLGVGEVPEALLFFRNFGQIDYWGIDASIQVLLSDFWQGFANISYVSDDFFDNEELGETNTSLAIALNAPTMKLKGGINYARPKGATFGVSGRFVKGFPVSSGPFVGGRPAPFSDDAELFPGVDDYFLLDVNIGYDLINIQPGLRFDVMAQNILDNRHREFVGAAKIGRLVVGRLNYTF